MSYKIIASDFLQCEPRVFSHYSGEKKLQDVFTSGEDFYSKIAIEMMGLLGYSAKEADSNFLKKKNPVVRQEAKVIALAIPYGSEGFQVATLLGYLTAKGKVDSKRGEQLVTKYLTAFPNLHKYMVRQELQAKKQGYVTNLFGRIRRIPEAKELYEKYGDNLLDYQWAKANGILELRRTYKQSLNVAKNFPIQATAADIINRAMIELAQYLTLNKIDASVRLNVHDELVVIAHESIAEAVALKVDYYMCNNKYAKMLHVPLASHAKVGNNLVEVK